MFLAHEANKCDPLTSPFKNEQTGHLVHSQCYAAITPLLFFKLHRCILLIYFVVVTVCN